MRAGIKGRTDRLLALPDEGGQHAPTIIARELHGLYLIDRDWSAMNGGSACTAWP
jgi:hypothetical protein